ncbi:cadherin-like beta sandwich domain-containing protein [Bacillus sp. sid0103]|uniref:cadherin-like beta sandwich domain-containing protein n=1 Tax=Bacillus sp. sid0103 TaxID=2856337 RepID=UPI001C44F873|nr:cadherin-like beta sandwich domain-containing protein [Bacillus sp. sid0103]MBV7503998.1 cadherin-like beta sandwich domain-containing protein [Bacillus sp. sid0103]
MKHPNKPLNVMLVFSLVWMGVGSYIPTAYAETNTATVQENQNESTLSRVEIEGVELDQKFASNLYEYSASVDNEVDTVKLLVESTNTDESITINGQTVISGTAGTYTLQTGENKFIISVNNGSNSSTTYTLTISREKNANNLLQNIELSKGELSPKFSSIVTDYNVNVPNEVPTIKIKSIAMEKTSAIKVNGILAMKDGVEVKVSVGKSDINITVTAENGANKTYTIHVMKDKAVEDKATIPKPNQNNKPGASQPSSKPNSPTKSAKSALPASQLQSAVMTEKASKALLSSLSVSEGTWDSTFTSDEFTYHVTVPSDGDEITLKPIAKYSGSDILIEGGTSKTIKLEADRQTIISVVVSYNDDDRKTYVLVFEKKS